MSAGAEFLKARDFLLTHRTDYEFAYQHFQWPRLAEFNWALDYFDPLAAGNTGTALWVLDESGAEFRVSFAEMSHRSNQVAQFLRELGVRRGDHMLLMLGNEIALWETLLAACKLGAVVIPAATLLSPEDLADRLDRGNVRHVIAGDAHTGKFAGLGGEYTRICAGGEAAGWHSLAEAHRQSGVFTSEGVTRASDPLLLYFTSGTTAKPKLVRHSHQSYPAGHLSTMYWIGLQPGDVHWNISTPGWAKHAWSCWFAPWNAGATVFTYNYARFNAKAVLSMLSRRPITTLCAPPTVWRMLVQEKLADYPVSLREAVSAGEPLNPEVVERVQAAWGITIRDGFGQTETTAVAGNPPGQRVQPGSMGRVLPGYRIELLDQAGQPAPEGEICLNLATPPLGLMLGYGGATTPADAAGAEPDGYYHTGDLASRDEEGYLTYIGRVDDVFKSSDYRISPFELESVLVRHPAVAEAGVVASSDPVRHAVPKAFVQLAPGYVASAELARGIFQFVRQQVAPYKRIRRLEFAELPKTISGKIRRAQLRTSGAPEAGREFREEEFPED
ncbi:MAG TPA: AMP-binding protein [Bryobacteraceae bacterium]|jgi:acetyl-CoA synthetase|nr:AMP-binding protein [Bryobacteraceae bacterium]